jgi:hypothetical protein
MTSTSQSHQKWGDYHTTSQLSSVDKKLRETFSIRLPEWQVGVERMMRETCT